MTRANCHIETWDQFRQGDNTALLELYNQHYVGLLNYGIKFFGDRDFASDSITQMLLRLWDNRHKLPPVENVRSYLLTTLRNELLSQMRQENARGKCEKLSGKISSQNVEPYDLCLIRMQENAELRSKLMVAFRKLTNREKELLQLKFFEDLDYDQIAINCQITKRTAYNIIHSALKTLKSELYESRTGTKIPLSTLVGFAILWGVTT